MYDSLPHTECDSQISSNCYHLIRGGSKFGNEIENAYSTASTLEDPAFHTKIKSFFGGVMTNCKVIYSQNKPVAPRIDMLKNTSIMAILRTLVFNDLTEFIIISLMLVVFAVIIFNLSISSVY